jgi:hypothetical protein
MMELDISGGQFGGFDTAASGKDVRGRRLVTIAPVMVPLEKSVGGIDCLPDSAGGWFEANKGAIRMTDRPDKAIDPEHIRRRHEGPTSAFSGPQHSPGSSVDSKDGGLRRPFVGFARFDRLGEEKHFVVVGK